MTVRVAAVFLLLCPLCTAASAQAVATRYISDEIAITLREDKGMNAPVAALLKSGTKVELMDEDAASGYAKVRVAQGREGWVLARYLSTEPTGREQLAAAQAEIAEQRAKLRQLDNEVSRLRDAPAGASAGASAAEPVVVEHAPGDGLEARDPVVMFTGAALFIAGLLTGLLIPMLSRPRARR